MPGLNLVFKAGEISSQTLADCHDDLQHREGYRVSELCSTSHLAISFSGYEGYPLQTCDDADLFFAVEGLIYNTSENQVESVLRSVADDFYQRRDYQSKIRECIDTFDGEYLVLLYLKKTGDLLVFNDRWARMPVFYSVQSDGIVLSRELKFILPWLEQIEFNRLWMTEFLVFEYVLGDKSIVNGVRTLKPAMLLRMAPGDDGVRAEPDTLWPANFDRTGPAMKKAAITQRCAELFRESLEVRARRISESGYRMLADLSGGHDSRAVFAGLVSLGCDFTTVNDHLIEGAEAEIADAVARLYGHSITKLNAPYPEPTLPELGRIVYATDGLINGYMSFVGFHDEIERARAITGRQVHFMGLGGEFLRHRYRPMKRYRDLVSMIDDGYFTNQVGIDEACALVRLPRGDFSTNVASEVSGFGEATVEGHVKHLNFERYNKFDNGGENRHRMFAWVVAPFWGKDLFEFNMQHIPVNMIDFHFFTDVLKALDPRTLEVPIYAGIMGINPHRRLSSFNVKVRLKTLFRTDPLLFTLAKRVVYRSRQQVLMDGPQGALAREALRLCTASDVLSYYFDPTAFEGFLQQPRTESQFQQALTLILYMSQVEERFGGKVRSA